MVQKIPARLFPSQVLSEITKAFQRVKTREIDWIHSRVQKRAAHFLVGRFVSPQHRHSTGVHIQVFNRVADLFAALRHEIMKHLESSNSKCQQRVADKRETERDTHTRYTHAHTRKKAERSDNAHTHARRTAANIHSHPHTRTSNTRNTHTMNYVGGVWRVLVVCVLVLLGTLFVVVCASCLLLLLFVLRCFLPRCLLVSPPFVFVVCLRVFVCVCFRVCSCVFTRCCVCFFVLLFFTLCSAYVCV